MSKLRSRKAQFAAQIAFRKSQKYRFETRSALHNRDDSLDLNQQKDNDDVIVERNRSFRQCFTSQTAAQFKNTSYWEHLFTLSEELFLEAIYYIQADWSHHKSYTHCYKGLSKIFNVVDSLCLLQRESDRLMHQFINEYHRSRFDWRHKHSDNEQLSWRKRFNIKSDTRQIMHDLSESTWLVFYFDQIWAHSFQTFFRFVKFKDNFTNI